MEWDIQNIQLLRNIHQANLDALPYQQAATRAIQKALKVDALWDTLFLFQSAENRLQAEDCVKIWTFDENSGDKDAKIQVSKMQLFTERSRAKIWDSTH